MVKSKLGVAGIFLVGMTVLLKISALIRDMVIAYYFGDSYAADAYLAAFIIPNIIFLLFSYGMKNAFVPSYIESKALNRGAFHFSQVMKGAVFSSAFLSAAGLIAAPFIVPLLYPAFDEQTTKLAVGVILILMIPVLFTGINAMLEAYLDAQHQFSYSVLSQLIVVLGVLGGAFLLASALGVYALAIGYAVGVLCSLAVKIMKIKPQIKANWKIPLAWYELKGFSLIFVPVAITAAVGQVNLMIDNMFASYFGEGAVTYVNYAKTLVHFPQAIFGVTIGTLIFPLLAHANANEHHKEFKQGISQGLMSMYFLLLPSIVGLMVLLPNVISLFYERGSFTHDAVLQTVQIGYYYAGSVLFFSMADVVNKGLYTLKKGYYILAIGLFSIIFNALFNYILTSAIGYNGISLASSLTGFLYFVIGFLILNREIGHIDKWTPFVEMGKVTASVLIMIGILHMTTIKHGAEWTDLTVILMTGSVGAAVFFLCAWFFRIKVIDLFLKGHTPR